MLPEKISASAPPSPYIPQHYSTKKNSPNPPEQPIHRLAKMLFVQVSDLESFPPKSRSTSPVSLPMDVPTNPISSEIETPKTTSSNQSPSSQRESPNREKKMSEKKQDELELCASLK